MSGAGNDKTEGVPPITDNPEVLPMEDPVMTKENEELDSTPVITIKNGTGTGVPCELYTCYVQ